MSRAAELSDAGLETFPGCKFRIGGETPAADPFVAVEPGSPIARHFIHGVDAKSCTGMKAEVEPPGHGILQHGASSASRHDRDTVEQLRFADGRQKQLLRISPCNPRCDHGRAGADRMSSDATFVSITNI